MFAADFRETCKSHKAMTLVKRITHMYGYLEICVHPSCKV